MKRNMSMMKLNVTRTTLNPSPKGDVMYPSTFFYTKWPFAPCPKIFSLPHNEKYRTNFTLIINVLYCHLSSTDAPLTPYPALKGGVVYHPLFCKITSYPMR